ncbi:MAG: hypothetical protein ACKO1U_08815 [Bacteroidota bacterium]
MVKYLVQLTAFTLLLTLLLYWAASMAPALFSVHHIGVLTLYFYFLSLVFHFGLVRASAGRPAVFVRYYMGATSIKLFIHLGVLVGFAFLHREKLFPFAITFLSYYLAFLIFEVITAFRQQRGGTAS